MDIVKALEDEEGGRWILAFDIEPVSTILQFSILYNLYILQVHLLIFFFFKVYKYMNLNILHRTGNLNMFQNYLLIKIRKNVSSVLELKIACS